VISERGTVVLKHVVAEAFKRDRLKKTCRDNPIGIDIVAAQRQTAAFEPVNTRRHGFLLHTRASGRSDAGLVDW
jgi:hypothetical protein